MESKGMLQVAMLNPGERFRLNCHNFTVVGHTDKVTTIRHDDGNVGDISSDTYVYHFVLVPTKGG